MLLEYTLFHFWFLLSIGVILVAVSHASYAVMVMVATRSNWFSTRDHNSSEFALSAQPSNHANIVSPARREQPYLQVAQVLFNGRGLQASISKFYLSFFLSNSTRSAAEFGTDELLLLFLFFLSLYTRGTDGRTDKAIERETRQELSICSELARLGDRICCAR